MSLITTFKADLLTARKAKDEVSKNLLTALVGEATAVGKNAGDRETTDEEAIALVKKFVKNAQESQKISLSSGRDTTTIDKEIEILGKYVPVQMTETSILAVLQDFKAKNTEAKLGDAMKYMKDNFAGIYDGKTASLVARDIFK